MRGLSLLALSAATACFTSVTLGANGTVDLVVAATTDVHGYIEGWNYLTGRPDTLRGLARLATIVDSIRRSTGAMPILVDAGDMLQGTALTYAAARIDTTVRNPVIAAMNAMEYDAAVIGNHEFDYGLPALDRALKQANFPPLAANVYGPNGQRRFGAWTVEIRRGVKVGIVGATTPGAMVLDRDQLAGQLQVRDIIPDVRSAVREVRNAGAAVVIAVVHSGLDEPSTYDTVGTGAGSENVAARLAHEVPGIDVIVYGHTHKEMADTVIAGTLLMQPKNFATSLAVAQLRLERRNGRWAVTYKHGRIIQAVHHREDSQVLAVAAEGHRARRPIRGDDDRQHTGRRGAPTPVASPRRLSSTSCSTSSAARPEHSCRRRPFSPSTTRSPRVRSPSPRWLALYPYDNTLRAVRITGAQLRAYLEHSARYFRSDANGVEADPTIPGYNYDVVGGVDYEIDVSRPIGDRVTRLEFQGKPVAPADTFTMAVSNFRQAGGGGFSMLHDAPVVYDQRRDIRELLIEEVREARNDSAGAVRGDAVESRE